MGLRVRRSIKVAPGVKVNIGKKSVGVSIGGKGGGVSYNSKTGVTSHVSIPGTGISYVEHSSSKKRKSTSQNATPQKASPITLRIWGVLLLIVGIAAVITGITIGQVIGIETILYIIGAICILLGIVYLVGSRTKQN